MKFILIFISLFFVFISHARVYRHSSMFQDVEWKLSTTNRNYFDEAGNHILLISKLYGLLNHSFLPTVDFSAEYILDTRQGATQSTYVSKQSNDQIYPAHMYLSVRPLESEPLFVRAGLINQDFLNAPLLISDWTFLGFQQEYILHHKALLKYMDNLKLVVQQTIPSSETGLEHLEQVQDIATFYTASLFASSFVQNEVQTTGNLTAFYFRNLSSATAEYGRVYGNEVRQDYFGPDAEFLYPFYGLYTRATARYNLFPELGLEFDASLLWNIGATVGAYQRVKAGDIDEDSPIQQQASGDIDVNSIRAKAFGYNMWMGLHIPIAKEVIMVLSLEYFNNDSNASPAYYNSDRYVHSGRYGVILGVKSIFEKYNVFFDLQYATIRSTPDARQSIGNPNYLSFEIGTEYDKI
ncbi:MAG: hypothetical protein OXK80_02450 [Bdellovibrionales bacterium]|nr:hypothetical protein [Bdellovibrionales bacterium]